MRRFLAWLRNPWAKARFLWVVAIAYMAWTLLPVGIAVLFSFNSTRALTAWQGFSTRWYVGDVNSVWNDPSLRAALFASLKLASLTVLIAVPLGVAFALALDRWHGRTAGTQNFLMLFSFITPEIAIGVALFLFVVQLATGIGLGFTAQLAGLSMYMMAYPVIVVRARLLTIGKEYEEAAMDLGAPPLGALGRVLLPLLTPAIFASVAIVFAAAIDNFVISSQLSSGAGDQTVPIMIYSAARRGPLPSLNALATLTLTASMLLIGLAVWLYRRGTRGERRAPTAPPMMPVA
ncbi:MAG TPA: ABC transporter permease [Actinomycetota bacterium]|nr:ABC transporter permease [Actinomycetota bacterium]